MTCQIHRRGNPQCHACAGGAPTQFRIESRNLARTGTSWWVPVESEPLYLDEGVAESRADDLEDMAEFTTYRVVPVQEPPHHD